MECYPTYRIISQEFLELLKGHFKIKQAYKKIIWLLKQNGAWIISLFTILYNVDSAELSIFVLFFSLRCLLDNHIFISTTEYNFSFVMNAIPARIVQINIMTYFLYILFFFYINGIYYHHIYKYHKSDAYSFNICINNFCHYIYYV